ncbi:MAG: hypothetical protein BGO68_03160 [Candidatus Amoebophilus sp. 36-38]|nr:MAG: hypothetical protein BGO68_03160 [Candidatus Amoebophilus sp. 36-38]
MAGGYNKSEKDRKGNSKKVLKKLISVVQEHKINHIIVEDNIDYSLVDLLKIRLKKVDLGKLEIRGFHQSKPKEERILNTLWPLLKSHRLIIDQKVLEEDFLSFPQDDLNYKFFYQFLTMRRKDATPTVQGFGRPAHDDRLDALVLAIEHLMTQFDKKEKHKDKEIYVIEECGMGAELPNHPTEKPVNLNLSGQEEATSDRNNPIAQEFCLIKSPHKPEFYKEFNIIQELAEQGDSDAQFNLGGMYYTGSGGTKNYQEAFKWFKKAADQGSAEGQYVLGGMYDEGKYVTRDERQAVEWYQKAADQGHAAAQCSLGFMYYNGQGVAQNYQKALEWHRKAADQGDANAHFNLGCMHYYGHGVKKDYQEALKWYQKAADLGYVDAQAKVKELTKLLSK